MSKVHASFDYEIVKKAVKLHYQSSGIDFAKLDEVEDENSCLTYLNYFSKIMQKYGIDNDSIMLIKLKKNDC